MATNSCSTTLLFLFLFLAAVLATASATDYLPSPFSCNCPKENETHLEMYLHQFPLWPTVPNPNEVNVIAKPPPTGFGTMYVDDWFLTWGPDPNGKIIGRAPGFHIQASQTGTSWFAGSTLHVSGIRDTSNDGQWSIDGGTRIFANAHGTVKFSISMGSGNTDIVYKLDIHVFYTSETT
ncbi:hypothetical protein ACP70R_035068 [Stipagrostis hirtigluma subsp. patula]